MLRHTRPCVKEGLCYGVTDLDLEPQSRESDIANVMAEVHRREYVAIYSSPLRRCLQLAEAISANKGGEVVVDSRLREMDFGEWEMSEWQDIFDSKRGKEWFEDFVHCKAPSGEAFVDVISRASSFIREVAAELKGDVLVVTHAGFIRATKVATNELSPQEVFDLQIKYGEIVEVDNNLLD